MSQRFSIAAVTVALLGACAGVESPRTNASTVPSSPSPPVTGYWIALPDGATGPSGGGDGSYEIDATTTLPDGTMAYIDSESTQSGGAWFLAVAGGRLTIRVFNNDCSTSGGTISSLPFTMMVSVAADYRNYIDGPPPPTPHWQPDSVYEALGDHFQNLAGPDVTTIAGMNVLQVSTQYQLPSDTCEPQRP